MRRTLAVTLAVVAALGASCAPAGARERPRVFAFGGTAADLAPHAAQVDVAAPNWFSVSGAGRVEGGARDYALLRLAHASGGEVWPTVNARLGFSRRWLATPVRVAARVARAARPFDGITLDVEEVPPRSRAAFTHFVRAVRARIGARGLAVYVTRRTASRPRRSAAAYDWRRLARTADLVLASTYGEHGPPGRPGPPVTADGFSAVLRYAQRVSVRRVAPVLAGFAIRWPYLGPGRGEVVSARGLSGRPPVVAGDSITFYTPGPVLRAGRREARRAGFRWVALFSLGREPAGFWRR